MLRTGTAGKSAAEASHYAGRTGQKASIHGDGGYDSIDNLPDREKPAACLRWGTSHDCQSAGGFYGMAGG